MKTKIKICGITDSYDAEIISDLDVDYVGIVYNFEGGERSIDLEQLIEIYNSIKNKQIKLVAVCVDKTIEELKQILKYVDIIQLHGNESVEYCKKLHQKYPYKKFWKAIKISSKDDLDKVNKYINVVNKILLDAGNSRDKLNNKNKLLNIELIKKIEKKYDKKFIIAGGIGLDNIDEIINEINPEIIDVSSKLEISPRRKNIKLIKKFLEKL